MRSIGPRHPERPRGYVYRTVRRSTPVRAPSCPRTRSGPHAESPSRTPGNLSRRPDPLADATRSPGRRARTATHEARSPIARPDRPKPPSEPAASFRGTSGRRPGASEPRGSDFESETECSRGQTRSGKRAFQKRSAPVQSRKHHAEESPRRVPVWKHLAERRKQGAERQKPRVLRFKRLLRSSPPSATTRKHIAETRKRSLPTRKYVADGKKHPAKRSPPRTGALHPVRHGVYPTAVLLWHARVRKASRSVTSGGFGEHADRDATAAYTAYIHWDPVKHGHTEQADD